MTDLQMVTITQKEYDKLKRTQIMYDCLESCGVDNWPGFDEAVREFKAQIGEDEDE